MTNVFYICNGKRAECKPRKHCDICHYTTNPKYAKYGACKDPKNSSRFKEETYGTQTYLVERRKNERD